MFTLSNDVSIRSVIVLLSYLHLSLQSDFVILYFQTKILYAFLIWVDNIKMDHREAGWGDMDWIDMAQDRVQWRALVNTVINLRVP
jgi:hypothetical protein